MHVIPGQKECRVGSFFVGEGNFWMHRVQRRKQALVWILSLLVFHIQEHIKIDSIIVLRLQNHSKSSEIIWEHLESFAIFQNLSVSFGVFCIPNHPELSRIIQNHPESTAIRWNHPESSGIIRNHLEGSETIRNQSDFFKSLEFSEKNDLFTPRTF